MKKERIFLYVKGTSGCKIFIEDENKESNIEVNQLQKY